MLDNARACAVCVRYIEQPPMLRRSIEALKRTGRATAFASGATGTPRSDLVCQICAMAGLKSGLANAASG